MIHFRIPYIYRILLLLLSAFVCLILASLMMFPLVRGEMSTLSLRLSSVIQAVVVFILPAVYTAIKITDRPASLLAVDRGADPVMILMAVVAMIVGIPALNALVEWNQNLSLPESLSGLEAWMKSKEDAAQASVKLIMGGTSVGDLILSLLTVAVLAGLSEELFFRGAFQRILASKPINHHAAIWITAFIFSAFHMQFYGFFPRLILGAYFGYLLWWSKSLWLPVLIHIFNNALVVFASWHERVTEASSVADDPSGWFYPSMLHTPWAVVVSILLTAVVIWKFFVNLPR